jgi:CRISPR-associated protein Cmr5
LKNKKKMAKQTTIEGIEQNRASFAFQCAQDIAATQGKKSKEYKSYAKKLPMLIKTNGLGASLAFVLSKSKNKEGELTAWGDLYSDIDRWLRQEHKIYLLGESPKNDLSESIIELNSPEYRALTVEILAFLNWLRRFAEGLIEGGEDETEIQ